jgi:adenine-specific DNA-methyltransferase
VDPTVCPEFALSHLFRFAEPLLDSGSIFVQIGDENIHRVRAVLDEVFGEENFCSLISFETTTGQTSTYLAQNNDFLLWYGKNPDGHPNSPTYGHVKLPHLS